MSDDEIWRVKMPWVLPPLSLNDRGVWQKRHRLTKQAMNDARYAIRYAQLPKLLDRVIVRLDYWPRVVRLRDADNLIATEKVCCDALVLEKIVTDDHDAIMARLMPLIWPADLTRRAGALSLVVIRSDVARSALSVEHGSEHR